MALCEMERLVIRIGVPYVFHQIGGCKKCAELAASARFAYGDETKDARYMPLPDDDTDILETQAEQ